MSDTPEPFDIFNEPFDDMTLTEFDGGKIDFSTGTHLRQHKRWDEDGNLVEDDEWLEGWAGG